MGREMRFRQVMVGLALTLVIGLLIYRSGERERTEPAAAT